jgi:trans-aconitate 2-methyltransferase
MTSHLNIATTYQFGDSASAAERLRILAQVFEPSTRDFLQSLSCRDVGEIADLGCGPGWTTRLLADAFPRAGVHGIDNSDAFISLARQTMQSRVDYAVGDATGPLPRGPFDLIYCRYLLTHLRDARTVIERWARELRACGAIAIEENEWIHTTQPAFARYLEIVEAMLAATGQRLYAGAELARDASWSALRVAQTEVVPIAVRDGDAARMFVLNIAGWRSQPFVVEHFAQAEIAALATELDRIALRGSPESSISFGRRRLVLERTRCVERPAN